MDQYAMYLRKSRADLEKEKLGEGETLKRHKEILQALAARQGLFVAEIYQEIVSGETISARPEIQRLIKDCYSGKYKGIIIIDVDRLSRGNQGDMQVIMDCLKYSNGRDGLLVVTPTKTYDVSHNTDDEEYMEFVLFMSRREYKTIQKRLDRGRKQAVVEGQFMGSYRPYGYSILKTKHYRTLEPVPEEAAIVQNIFEWFVNGQMTPGEIARKLTAMKVPTYLGDPEWSNASVKTILQNPTYNGKVRWNDRMVVKTIEDGKVKRQRPRSNHTSHYMEYDGMHKAIVDDEIWAKAQGHFYHDKTKFNNELKNAFAGLLVCQKCQKSMIYNGYTTKPTVQPRILHRQSTVCGCKSVFYDDVMNAMVDALLKEIEDCECMAMIGKKKDESAIEEQIHLLEKEKKSIEKKLSKIFDDYEEGIYTPNEFIERKTKHNERLAVINKQLEELSEEAEAPAPHEKIYMLHDAIRLLQDPDVSAKTKNKFLKSFIEKIEYSSTEDKFRLDVYAK